MNEKDAKKDDKREKAAQDEAATDPQESMRGPVSSVIQKIKEAAEENDDKESAKHEYKKSHTGGDFINE